MTTSWYFSYHPLHSSNEFNHLCDRAYYPWRRHEKKRTRKWEKRSWICYQSQPSKRSLQQRDFDPKEVQHRKNLISLNLISPPSNRCSGQRVLHARNERGVQEGVDVRGKRRRKRLDLPQTALSQDHSSTHGRVPGRLLVLEHVLSHGNLQIRKLNHLSHVRHVT